MQNLPSNGNNGYDVAWIAAAWVITGSYWSGAQEREHKQSGDTDNCHYTAPTHALITRVGICTPFQLMPYTCVILQNLQHRLGMLWVRSPFQYSPSLHSRATLDSKLFICTSRVLISFFCLRRLRRHQQSITMQVIINKATPLPTPIHTSIGITLLSASLNYSSLPREKSKFPTTTYQIKNSTVLMFILFIKL